VRAYIHVCPIHLLDLNLIKILGNRIEGNIREILKKDERKNLTYGASTRATIHQEYNCKS
jgi:hypothetical protein